MTKPKPPLPAAADLFGDVLDTETAKRTSLREYWPGFALAVAAALAAAWISEHYGAPLMLMGLLIGLAFNFANADDRVHAGLGFASTTLLRWGIVLAGLQITLGQIASLGWIGFAAIALIVAVVIGIAVLVSRALGLSPAFGALAGGAVAICGASAAMAIATLLGERRINQAQLTLVLVTIAAASAVAMSVYPLLANAIGFDDRQAGWVMGVSIHDVAQALGAGYSISDEAGETAAIVKLTRVALLAPTLAILALFFPADVESRKGVIAIPWFVLGFLAMGLANSLVALPDAITDSAQIATQACLLLAVTATGIRSPMHLLLGQGFRSASPILVATLLALGLGIGASYLLG